MDDFLKELQSVNKFLLRGLLITLGAAGAFFLYLLIQLFNMGPWL